MTTVSEYIAQFGEEKYRSLATNVESPAGYQELADRMNPAELLKNACGTCENCVKPSCGSCGSCKVNRFGNDARCCFQKVGTSSPGTKTPSSKTMILWLTLCVHFPFVRCAAGSRNRKNCKHFQGCLKARDFAFKNGRPILNTKVSCSLQKKDEDTGPLSHASSATGKARKLLISCTRRWDWQGVTAAKWFRSEQEDKNQ